MNILEELEKMLKNEYKKEENKNKHITYLREKVLKEAKEKKIIKDYYKTQKFDYKNIYFGSCVGYDQLYRIIL